MTATPRVLRLLAAAVAFGVTVALIKGQAVGVRDALGNTSAPWVVLPFIAGTHFPRARSAAAAGLAVTLISLLSFYIAEAAILNLGPHPWWVDLRLTAGSMNIYEQWGIFSGLLYGTLGWLWAYRSKVGAAAAVGLAFAAEPLIAFLAQRDGIWGAEILAYRWLWVSEVVIGIAGIALALAAPRPRASGL